MESVQIPQDVEVEDKIVGPFSIRQLIIIGLGSGVSYALFATIRSASGGVPLAAHLIIWWPAVLAAAFAIIRINDISLFRHCLLILEMFSRPRLRVWQPREGLEIFQKEHTMIEAGSKVTHAIPFLRSKKSVAQEERMPERPLKALRELSDLIE